jgi:hypothetical protein
MEPFFTFVFHYKTKLEDTLILTRTEQTVVKKGTPRQIMVTKTTARNPLQPDDYPKCYDRVIHE